MPLLPKRMFISPSSRQFWFLLLVLAIGRISLAATNPWELDLMIRSSSDGSSFGPETLFCKAAGVPSLIRDHRGRLLAAFQWFPQNDPANWDRVAVKISTDNGGSWSEPQPIRVDSLPEGYQRPFDPTLAVLDDGRIRIYFSSNPSGKPTLQAGVATYSAISTDGIHYSFEPGARFGVAEKAVIDPAVIRLGSTWHYTAPIGRPEEGAYHAISSDGLNFTRIDNIPSVDGVNWTGNLVLYADGMRFYGGSSRGIWWAFSKDGNSWTPPVFSGFQGGDPSVVPTEDGNYRMVYVGTPTAAPPAFQVEYPRAGYRAAGSGTIGFFRSGQEADILLSGIDFNNTGGPLLFNHPGGIGGDGYRVLLADRNNNRILIWLTPPQGNTPPDLVLGQPDFQQNNPGTALHQLNWPCAVTAAANGRIAVADTNNDRLLLWNRFPSRNGAAADLEIQLPVLGSGGPQRFGWPWGVWTDGERLAATATHGGAILFWRNFPSRNNQPPDYTLSNAAFGTLRAISSDGTFLIVDDHNARIPGSASSSEQGTFFWKNFPTSGSNPYDFAISGVRLRGGWVDGRLVLLGGSSMRIWNAFPSGAADPAALTIPGPWNSDGVGLTVASGTLYTLDENQNKILAFRSLPSPSNAAASFVIGAPDTAANTLRTHYFITNPVPVSNNTSLFVSSDFDRKLYVWRRLPDESGARPDLVYSLPEAPWANALLDNTLVLAGKRTVYLWNRLPLDGELPSSTLSNAIGNVSLGEIRGVALDSRYFYLSDYQSGKLYVWKGIPAPGSNPAAVIDVGGQPTRISSDGNTLAVTLIGPPPAIKLYSVAELESGSATAAVVTRPGFNLPEGSLVARGSLFIADTVFNRVLAWSRLSDAAAGRDPDIVLGAADMEDKTPEIGRDKLFWPGALSWDGSYLWVGEFKFSGRLLRFSPSDANGRMQLIHPRFIHQAASLSGLALVNASPSPADASFTAFDNSGRVMTAADLTNPTTRTLPRQGQLALTASQLFGNGLNTDGGWLRITSDSSGVAGFFLDFDPEVNSINGAVFSRRLLHYFLLPEAGGTEISLVNPANTPAIAAIHLKSEDGSTAATAPLTLPAGGRLVKRAEMLFSAQLLSSGGYLEVSSESGLAALQVAGLPGAVQAALSPIDPYGGSRRLYAPQYAAGGGWQSSVTLINLESRPTNVSLTLRADDGAALGRPFSFTLPAGGKKTLAGVGIFGVLDTSELVQGYLQIDSDAARLAGIVRFGDPGETRFLAALPLVDRSVTDLLFPHMASDEFYFTGLAVLNPDSEEADVEVTILDSGGQTAASRRVRLAAGERFARLISELFPALPPMNRGYFRLRSTRPVTACATFGTHALTAISAIPAQ